MVAAPVAAYAADKHFSLTHIVYDPADPAGVLLALFSLSPIFLFVSYFTLLVFGRRLSLLLLAGGSVLNEALSLALKRWLKSPRPFPSVAHIGHGYGMPSSHAQAAAFLVAWGAGYATSLRGRYARSAPNAQVHTVRQLRTGIYLFGVVLWSLCVAYSRYALRYHSVSQVGAGYIAGLVAGAVWYLFTEHIPRRWPRSPPGRIRTFLEWLWVGVGGVGGWQLGGTEGGWGEGWACGVQSDRGRALDNSDTRKSQ